MQRLSIIVMLTCLQVQTSFGRSLYVRQSGKDNQSGTTASQAFRTIERAVRLARPGDVIYVGRGTYAGFRIKDRSGQSDRPIRIVGDLDGRHTGDKGRPEIHSGRRSKGAIHLDKCRHFHFRGLTINQSREDGFRIEYALGIVIQDCLIDNMNDEGFMIRRSHVAIRDCKVTNNDGNGIYLEDSSAVIERCIISGNRRSGIETRNGTAAVLKVNRCTMKGNRGAGAYLRYRGRNEFRNCLFVRNRREGVKSYGDTKLYHCTIVYQDNDGVEGERGQLELHNCLVAFNRQSGLQRDGGTVTSYFGCVYGNRQGHFSGQVTHLRTLFQDPKIGRFYRPLNGSPLIDHGKNGYARVDLDGLSRPQGDSVDIGAFEHKKRDRPTVYYVKQSGGSDSYSGEAPDKAWASINHAFKNLEPGDTLYVGGGRYRVSRAGSYLKGGRAGKPIKIIGDPAGERTGEKGQAVIYDHTYGIDLRQKNDVHFENLALDGRHGGLAFEYCDRITVANCRLSGRYYAFSIRGAKVKVTDCTFHGGETALVHCDSSTLTLEDCEIGRTRGKGIFATRTRSVWGQPRCIVKVARCRIVHCSRQGLYAERSRIEVSDTLFTNNSIHCFLFDGDGTARLSHCTIVGGLHAVRLDGFGGLSLHNSILYRNTYGIYRSYRHQVKLSHNLFYAVSHPHLSRQPWGRLTPVADGGYKVADPLFVDPRSDYRLQPKSPAIDHGMDSTSAKDLASNPRPKFNGFDIGCYESQKVEQEDPDPGANAPVAPLWGVTSNDAMLFRIGNYNRPIATLARFGRLQSKQGLYLDRDIDAMTIDRAARMYVAYRASGTNGTTTFLGRLNLNHLTDPDRTKGSAVSVNDSKMVLQPIGTINHRNPVTGMALDPSTKKLFVVTRDRLLMSVDLKTGRIDWKSTIRFARHSNPRSGLDRLPPSPSDLTFDQDGNLYVADLTYFLLVVDKTTGQVKTIAKSVPTGTWEALAFDHVAGRLIASNTGDRRLYHVRLSNKGIFRDLGNTGLAIEAMTSIPGDGTINGKLRIVEWRETRMKK